MVQASAVNRITKPSHGKPVHLTMKEPELSVLDNGIEAYCIDAGEEEVSRIDIVINAIKAINVGSKAKLNLLFPFLTLSHFIFLSYLHKSIGKNI